MAADGPPGDVGGGAQRSPWHVRALAGFMALALCAMMTLTFVDVIGRYFFNAPVAGGFEIVAFLLALVIFSGLALVTRDQQHITVGLFDGLFRGRVQRVRELVILVGSVVMVGFIAERMWSEAEFLRRNDMYAEYLDIPLAPVQYGVACLGMLACAYLLGALWRQVRSGSGR